MTGPGDGTLAGRLDDYQPRVIGHVDVAGFDWPPDMIDTVAPVPQADSGLEAAYREADHPRDPHTGKWIGKPGGGARHVPGGLTAEADVHERTLRAGMRPDLEDSILLQSDGTAVPGTGGHQAGPGGLREWTSEFDVPETAYQGAILLHTHPDGQSLSDNDIRLAVVKGMAEIRAIGPDQTYVLRPGTHRSILDAERFFDARAKLGPWAEQELARRGGIPPFDLALVRAVLDERELKAARAAGLDYTIRPAAEPQASAPEPEPEAG